MEAVTGLSKTACIRTAAFHGSSELSRGRIRERRLGRLWGISRKRGDNHRRFHRFLEMTTPNVVLTREREPANQRQRRGAIHVAARPLALHSGADNASAMLRAAR